MCTSTHRHKCAAMIALIIINVIYVTFVYTCDSCTSLTGCRVLYTEKGGQSHTNEADEGYGQY